MNILNMRTFRTSFLSFLYLIPLLAFSQEKELIREYKNKASMQWMARNIACNAACITGDCDKGSVCLPFSEFQEAFRKCGIDHGFYIRERKLFLKATYKKYFLGNTPDTRFLKLLADQNDRFLVYITGRPSVLTSKSLTDYEPVLKVYSSPVSMKDLEDKTDLFLCKIPDLFPDSFEVGVESAKYCNKLVCTVWSPHHRMYLLKHEMEAQKYPYMPLVIDTLSAPSPEVYSARKKLTLDIPFPGSKQQFSSDEIAQLIDSLNEPHFVIHAIKITAYPSMLGDSALTIRQQKTLAENFIRNLSLLPGTSGMRSRIKVDDAWQHFRKQILLTNYYYLADSGERAVRNMLQKDPRLRARLTPLLNELSTASVELEVAFDPKKYPEVAYWHYKMTRAVEKNQSNLALSYQIALIRLCAAGQIPPSDLLTPEVPANPYYLTLWNNQCVFISQLPEQKQKLESLRQIDPNNPLVKFNYLAAQLNEIKDYQEDTLRDAMLFLITDFNTINASSIPQSLYQIMQARFHIYLNTNKRNRQLESYADIKQLSKVIPHNEAIKLADDFAHIGRYDIATPVLLDHYETIPADQQDLITQYALRLLYYGKYSGLNYSDEMYIGTLTKLYETDKPLFRNLFDTHLLSYLFLANPRLRSLYVQSFN